MEQSEPVAVVSDAGPIIHLDELNELQALRGFQSILTPDVVWVEILRHRPALKVSSVPTSQIVKSPDIGSASLRALADAFALDIGERAGLRLVEMQQDVIFLTDDSGTRLAAESLGVRVHGTVGILIRSIRHGYRSRDEIVDLLYQLPQRSTLHISRQLLDDVIARVLHAS